MSDQVGPASSDVLTWGISAAAGQIGVAAGTLRTWDRRYGVGPAVRTVGGHRRYTTSDIDRVRQMAELIAAGASPESAARAVLDPEVPAG